MDLNDYRAKAYKVNSVNSENNNSNKKENNINQEKKLFSDVNIQIEQILNQKRKELNTNLNTNNLNNNAIKNNALIKVPTKEEKQDSFKTQQDSVYRRVAKFLLLIGVNEAAKILPHLSAEQIDKITKEIVSIRNISTEESSLILAEFKGLLDKSRESGGMDTAREILEKTYGPQKAEEILNKAVPFSGGKPFDYLNDADSERIYYLLKDEVLAVKTLVLSHLVPKKAASVINYMPSEEKKEVMIRLVKLQPVSPEVLKRIDHAIHEKSLRQTSEKAENLDGRNALAQILKQMPVESENQILSSLSQEDPDLSQDLRSRLFTIEDVIKADSKFIQNKLREMSDLDIAYLITGKTQEFIDKIFSCISSTRKEDVLQEIEINKPLLKKECDRITSLFFSILRRAFEDGKLIIQGRNDDIFV